MTLPPASDPTRKRLLAMAERPSGMHRKDIRDVFSRESRDYALSAFDAMAAAGVLLFLKQGREVRYFATAKAAQQYIDRLRDAPLVLGTGMESFPVPVEEKRRRRRAMQFIEPTTKVRSDGVVVSACKGFTHDPRYQVEPGAKVYGAGFAAVGPGRDVDTGKGWAASPASRATGRDE
jgi:hypothetical protein